MPRDSLLGDFIKGLVAGGVATWGMGHVTTYLYEHESPESRRRYEEVTGGVGAPERTAEKVASALGLELSEEQRRRLSQGLHWAVGIGGGAAYALARRRMRRVDAGQGLLFGLAFWLVFDETLTVLTGAARPPQEYPWQAHGRGLAGHLAYGVLTDTALDLMGASTAH